MEKCDNNSFYEEQIAEANSFKSFNSEYDSVINEFPVFSIEQEKKVFKKIAKGHKCKILKFKKVNGFDTPLPDFEVIFSTITKDRKGISNILKLYKYFKSMEDGNKIAVHYLEAYLALYNIKKRIPSFTDLNNLFNGKELDYFTEFNSNKTIDKLEKRVDTLIEYYENRTLAINSNMRLAIKIASKYYKFYEMDDLIIEASTGLMKAVDDYDLSKGFKFSTYATWWIRQHATRSISDQAKTIRIPVHANELAFRINRLRDELRNELDREPSEEEIAKGIGMSTSKLNDFMFYTQEPTSLDIQVSEDEDNLLGDFIQDTKFETPEQVYNKESLKDEINNILLTLNPREREVVNRRFGLNGYNKQTLEQIGEEFNITRERVRQIESKALRHLKSNTKAKQNLSYYLYK